MALIWLYKASPCDPGALVGGRVWLFEGGMKEEKYCGLGELRLKRSGGPY